jgi:hypothetical protein
MATTSTTEIISVKETLNEYFKLKLKYEEDIMKTKKKIINNNTLSNKEKRAEYLKLKPKCINCKKPGGTIFQIVFFPSNDTDDTSREYRARCGVAADPCNLDIKIKLYKVDSLPDILDNMEQEIKKYKNNIIDDKNKLLFGYIDTETALSNFDTLKEDVSLTSSLYEEYLSEYNKVVDNPEKKQELNQTTTDVYIQIQQIKDCIDKMNETNNSQFARDAVNIYETVLMPLLSKIRNLKYSENMVVYDDYDNSYHLIQNKYSIESLSYGSSQDKVLAYNVGYQSFQQTKEKKPLMIIETSSEDEPVTSSRPIPTGEIPEEEPIYGEGKDGITWRNKDYLNVWEKLPEKLKNALRPNPEWLKAFMYNCVNARAKNQPCVIITPQNIKLPPIVLSNGQYDFGVPIYSELFNKLPQTLQNTYLTFFSEKDGVKEYKMLENAMNDLIAKEVDFGKGYF